MIRQVNKKFWRTFFSVFLDTLLIVALILIFLWIKKIAYYSFSNRPYQRDGSRTIEIQIDKKETVKAVAAQLERQGIIGDKKYLIIRYQCSTYHIYKLRAGTYQVSSDMGVDDLLDEFTGR